MVKILVKHPKYVKNIDEMSSLSFTNRTSVLTQSNDLLAQSRFLNSVSVCTLDTVM